MDHCTYLSDADVDAPSYLHLAYRPGVPLVRETLVRGRGTR